MDEVLIKANWKKISSASNSSDDVWIKDKYAIVRGYYGTTFYLEEMVNGKLLAVGDPNRKTIKYELKDLGEAIYYVDFSIKKRIREIRDNKLNEIGI